MVYTVQRTSLMVSTMRSWAINYGMSNVIASVMRGISEIMKQTKRNPIISMVCGY